MGLGADLRALVGHDQLLPYSYAGHQGHLSQNAASWLVWPGKKPKLPTSDTEASVDKDAAPEANASTSDSNSANSAAGADSKSPVVANSKPPDDCASNPARGCSCPERYRCVTKEAAKDGKVVYSVGCPVPDSGMESISQKYILAEASYNRELCKKYFGSEDACMCVKNAEYSPNADTEPIRLPSGEQVDANLRYPLLEITEEVKNALTTGSPMSRPPRKLLLSRDEWIKAWNGEKNVHGMMQDVLDSMHKDIVATTKRLDKWESTFGGPSGCPPCPCAQGAKPDAESAQNSAVWSKMNDSERDAQMERAVAEVQMTGNRYKTFQSICQQMQATEMKVVPPEMLGNKPLINCYLDETEKLNLQQMWKELGDLSAKMQKASLSLDVGLVHLPKPAVDGHPSHNRGQRFDGFF